MKRSDIGDTLGELFVFVLWFWVAVIIDWGMWIAGVGAALAFFGVVKWSKVWTATYWIIGVWLAGIIVLAGVGFLAAWIGGGKTKERTP